MHDLENQVRQLRITAGLSQQELGDRSGLTRQGVSAIESGRYVPNAAVALRLARALNRRVEDLFTLPSEPESCHARLLGDGEPGDRVVATEVRGRVVAYPLSGERLFQEGFATAEGCIAEGRGRVELFVPQDQLKETASLLGCDPSLGILAARLARRSEKHRLLWVPTSSRAALDAVARGEGHVAGCHFPGQAGGDGNLTFARRMLSKLGGLVVAYAAWEQGLMTAPGNPKKLRSIQDLAHSRVKFVNRERGSGSRRLLDDLLKHDGIQTGAISGYNDETSSHLAVARTVKTGRADAGIGLRAVARACGLDFVPFAQMRFDLIIPRDHVEHPVVQAMLDLLNSGSMRGELATLAGYEVSATGSVVADLPAAA